MRLQLNRVLAGILACILSGALSVPCGGRRNPVFADYQAPPMAEAYFHPEAAEGNDAVQIDLSGAGDGVIALRAYAQQRLKFQAIQGESTYTYDLASDGTPSVFPLQCGSGHYLFRVMENVSGTKYAMLYQTEADISVSDEFAAFLRPSDYVNYTDDAACVQKAAELAQGAQDANEVVASVYSFICDSVVYDKEKAQSVQSGYLPDPDETLATGKGICFDYAALAAAMLRSQGIPTRLIFGYVSPNDVYHAWNMFYTDENGWVTVDYQVSANAWNRIDLTFSANGADGEFIGNGSNYTDVFFY